MDPLSSMILAQLSGLDNFRIITNALSSQIKLHMKLDHSGYIPVFSVLSDA